MSRAFAYTAERRSYVSIAFALVGLLLIEGGMTAVLAAALLHVAWLRVAIHAALAVLAVAAAIALFAPLLTRHRLTSTHLCVRYGLDVRAAIPLDAVAEAQAWHEPVATMQPFRARYDDTHKRLLAAFSARGQVRLRFRRPVALRVGVRPVVVETLLINADRADELLAALVPTAARDARDARLSPTTYTAG